MVLLHEIEAARPVDLAMHGVRLEVGRQNMPDDVAIRLRIEHLDIVQRALVARLPATLRVKSRSVERNRRLALPCGASEDARIEVAQIGVIEIEPFCAEHVNPSGVCSGERSCAAT